MKTLTAALFVALMMGVIARSSAQADEKGAEATLFARALGVDPSMESPNVSEQHRELARLIGKDIVCLCGTCPKRLVTDCDCGWAKLEQVTLLNAVAEQGQTREALVAKYREVYGAVGLALPPDDDVLAKGAWALPYAGAAAGLFFVFAAGWRFRKRGSEAPEEPPSPEAQAEAALVEEARAELARELEDLD